MREAINVSEWTLVASNGEKLVGKLEGNTLSPVLKLYDPLAPQNGTFAPTLALYPFMGGGLRSIVIPDGALKVSIADFQGNERNWAKLIGDAVELEMAARMARAGIVAGNGSSMAAH